MKLMLQFGKVQLEGLMHSTECGSQGVWMTEVPPTQGVDKVPPWHLNIKYFGLYNSMD